jgi:hypothetical protein
LTDRRALRATAAVAGTAGAALFVWSVRAAGTAAVIDGVTRVGRWFVLICVLGGLRYLVRAVAWRACLDEPHELPLATAFYASVAGDALGNVTPFGAFVSEPSKVLFVRRRVGTGAAIAALTIENLLYSGTVVFVLACGTAALMLSYDPPPGVRRAAYATLGVALGLAVAATVVLMRRIRIVSGTMSVLARVPLLHDAMIARRPQVEAIGDRVFGFLARHPGRLAPILALESAYHAAAVLEIWLTVTLITAAPVALVTAFVLEFVNRTITIAFQFVPMWLGVDEAGTGLVATALRLGAPVGVGLALVRKARILIWTTIGLGLVFASKAWSRRGEADDLPDHASNRP